MAVQLAPLSPPASTPWRRRPPRARSPRRGRPPRRTAACALAAALVSLAVEGAGPAWGRDAVNVTFHVPAQGQTNPRFPAEVVNLNGDIHVVIATTSDRSRGDQGSARSTASSPARASPTGTQDVNSKTQEGPGTPRRSRESHKHPRPRADQQVGDRRLRVAHADARDRQRDRLPTAAVDNLSIDRTGKARRACPHSGPTSGNQRCRGRRHEEGLPVRALHGRVDPDELVA
jgi:hypothetical protein